MRNSKTLGSGSSLSGAVLTQQDGTPRWSRRHFLTASAMAGTGVLLGPEFAGAAWSSANPHLRGGAVPIEDLPREQTLILQNPEGVLNNPGLVQHLGRSRWRMVDRSAAVDDGHALVH